MKNNNIIYIVIGFTILLFVGIYISLLFNKNTNKDITDKTENKLETIVEKKILYTFSEATDLLQIQNCSKLVKEDIGKEVLCKDTINNSLAFKYGDVKYCELIENKKSNLKCKLDLNKYLLNKAYNEKSHDICLSISNTKKRGECLQKIDDYYYSTNNCKNIFNQEFKKQCTRKKNANFILDSLKLNDSSLCNRIDNVTLKNKCIKSVDKSIFLDAYDKLYCNKIQNDKLKRSCFEKINFTSGDYDRGNKQYCEKLENEEFRIQCLDSYYLNNIETGKNSLQSTCNKIVNIEVQNYCSGILVQKEKQKNKKQEIEKSKAIGDILGVIKGQCGLDNSGTDVNNCIKKEIIQEAIKKNDIGFCENLTDISQKNTCKGNVQYELDSIIFKKSISEKNTDLCKTLSTKEKEEACINYFN